MKIAYHFELYDDLGSGTILTEAQTIEQVTKELYYKYGALLKTVERTVELDRVSLV